MVLKTCAYCGNEFTPLNARRIYCRYACNLAAHKIRKMITKTMNATYEAAAFVRAGIALYQETHIKPKSK